MNETGFVKFNCNWINEALLDVELIKKLNICRDKLYESGFIGVNKDGIGYGNISIRYLVPGRHYFNNQFIITGSATGKINILLMNTIQKL